MEERFMEFKELSTKKAYEREQETSKYWDKINLLQKTIDERDPEKEFVFYDGPPTANGHPGIHHVISRALKDITCRYKTMSGYRVLKKAGWDTHGLPVEIEVEKKLGLHNKKDIEDFGVEKFNEECKASVFRYEKEWRDMSEQMAFLVDMDDPYITLENDYIQSSWWLLDQMFEKGLIYKGAKILPYCPRCGTGLASHEVAQGYEMITTETVTVAFKRKDHDEYFLAWTTTPWTLASNTSLTVHPDFDYVLVQSRGNKFYVEKDLADSVFGEGNYEILNELKGKDMEYMEYEQLMPFYSVNKKAFFVTCNDYVTKEDGTGIVHTAPAFGEDDYNTARKYDLPLINPVNEEGQFVGGPWDGEFVMDADPKVIDYLRKQELLFSKQKVDHNYPHCWRCQTPLIYYSKPSWYIEVTKVKDQLIKNNQSVHWFPEHVGEGRFGNWLENLKDWAISRSRYWGTPLNIWTCDECGHVTSVGSRKELKERALEDITEDIELHRPYVDDVHLKCDKCQGKMTREPDVVDVWFDSGAMPFAQMHYPFEHKDDFFTDYFPADFICEGIDQTRGWFYSLLAISTMITGKAPYKNVLVNDLVLDKEGKKMSKSRGNTLNPFELFKEFGADVVRFYSIYVSPPWVPTKFDTAGLKEVDSKFFRSFRNTYNFFQMYANTDEIDPRNYELKKEKLPEIDRWILSKYHQLIRRYYKNMDVFDYTRVVKDISNFVIEDLSNWYIRRNRRRFWKTDVDEDKKAVYKTTYEILMGVSKLVAPFTPFIAEEIFHKLTNKESVHLELLPKVEDEWIDKSLEYKMDLVRELVGLGRASREAAEIKVRQPLQKIIIDEKYKDTIGDLNELIKEELNVKQVDYRDDLSEYMNYELKPDFRKVGQILGSKIPAFQKYLKTIDPKEFVERFDDQDSITVKLDGESVEIQKDFFEIRISAKEGFDVETENNLFVILDTGLNEELLKEGYAREFVSKVQQMRKSKNLDVMDNIKISYEPTDKIKEAVLEYQDFIKRETLCVDILEKANTDSERVDLNGEEILLDLEKVE